MDAERGVVRWRIDKGVLVARRGRQGDGYLEIDLRRLPCRRARQGAMHVEVEIANFYPSIASRFGQWLYAVTQSRIHVLVTYGFLRSLAKLDLAESRVGRFAEPGRGPRPAGPVALRAARRSGRDAGACRRARGPRRRRPSRSARRRRRGASRGCASR